MNDKLVERLRLTLHGVSTDSMGGDNLAIVLASHFEPSIEDDEMDDSGTWKQGAIDICEGILDAIHAHYADALEAQQARIAELEALAGDNTTLFMVLADIREQSGVGVKPMLSELAQAIGDRIRRLGGAVTGWPTGTRVRKKSGSWWEGHVVGRYSTEQTPDGYCVQLERPHGPVQIYPASALESADDR